jgi:phage nucleotide-binding protein
MLGHAFHTGLEKGLDEAVNEYLMSYPIITDEHIDEVMKLEHLIPLAKKMLPNGEFETLISNSDFIGFIDFLSTEDDVNYDLYDFKYSNNADKYRQSGQLHVYKYFWEQLHPDKRINRMFFLMIPKAKNKRGKKEELGAFRERIQEELNKIEPFLVPIEYDPRKVVDFVFGMKHALEESAYLKSKSYFCNWCEYQIYCEKGIDFMVLPKNERRNIETVNKRTIWLYGSPFSGKTTFANKFPDALMLNTDGNITFVDAPYIAIKNDVRVEGRMTKTTLAWEVFKDAIAELEKKENDFKTIVVDLLEDFYEHCRLYMYQQMGITHESDDSFRAWDKVRTEFLSTMKRLMNMDYENIILISHEDTSKDITRKGGDKITAIKPNLQEKTSNKVAGMVHIVARVVADGDVRTLSFKTNEVIFGGGRLTVEKNEIPLDYEEFLKVYDEASKNAASAVKGNPATASTTTQDNKRRSSRTSTPPPDEQTHSTLEDLRRHSFDADKAALDADEDARMNEQTQSIETSAGDIEPEPATEPENKLTTRTRKRRAE